jgi:hypothetical protein
VGTAAEAGGLSIAPGGGSVSARDCDTHRASGRGLPDAGRAFERKRNVWKNSHNRNTIVVSTTSSEGTALSGEFNGREVSVRDMTVRELCALADQLRKAEPGSRRDSGRSQKDRRHQRQ